MAASDSDAGGEPGSDGVESGDTVGDSEDRPDGTDRGNAVALRDVRKTYYLGEPVHALDGVTLSISRGSYTAVMGPSGSGKSTLLNLIGCLDTPTEGEVWVNDREVSALSQRARTRVRGQEVGFVFQTFNLMPKLTAAENVALPLVFAGVGRDERADRATDLLEQVGLGDRLDHQPNELSGGQRQRVAIARALANDPAILLADEPTGNLDQETGERIMGLFQRLHDEGNTILMVTHERPVAEHAQRVVHVLDGTIERIEEIASPRRVESERP
jgi:putative ABC transport system ATP-binding protein